METLISFIHYVYNWFFVKDIVFLPIKYVEPTEDQINQLIDDTIKEIKLDREIFILDMRYNNLLRDEFKEKEQENENDNDENNDGAVSEKKIPLPV